MLPWKSQKLLRPTEKTGSLASPCRVNKVYYHKNASRKKKFDLQPVWRFNKRFTFQQCSKSLSKLSAKFNERFLLSFCRVVCGVMLAVTLSAAVSKSPCCKCFCLPALLFYNIPSFPISWHYCIFLADIQWWSCYYPLITALFLDVANACLVFLVLWLYNYCRWDILKWYE